MQPLPEPTVEPVRYRVTYMPADHPQRGQWTVPIELCGVDAWRVGTVGEWLDEDGVPGLDAIAHDWDTADRLARTAAVTMVVNGRTVAQEYRRWSQAR